MFNLKKKKTIIIFAIFIILIFLWFIPHPLMDQVKALFDETGAYYKIKSCSGGKFTRKVHCKIIITHSELKKLIANWGLDESLPYFEGEKRLIFVPDDKNPSSYSLRKKYSKAFGIQQWLPTRHGFGSVILFYNKQKCEGCLFLSIAYG